MEAWDLIRRGSWRPTGVWGLQLVRVYGCSVSNQHQIILHRQCLILFEALSEDDIFINLNLWRLQIVKLITVSVASFRCNGGEFFSVKFPCGENMLPPPKYKNKKILYPWISQISNNYQDYGNVQMSITSLLKRHKRDVSFLNRDDALMWFTQQIDLSGWQTDPSSNGFVLSFSQTGQKNPASLLFNQQVTSNEKMNLNLFYGVLCESYLNEFELILTITFYALVNAMLRPKFGCIFLTYGRRYCFDGKHIQK